MNYVKWWNLTFTGYKEWAYFCSRTNGKQAIMPLTLTVTAKRDATWHASVILVPPIGFCWELQSCVSLQPLISWTTRQKYILLDRNGHRVYKQSRHDPNTRCPLLHKTKLSLVCWVSFDNKTNTMKYTWILQTYLRHASAQVYHLQKARNSRFKTCYLQAPQSLVLPSLRSNIYIR